MVPFGGAAVAQWIHLHIPSCRPGFESQAHHLCLYQYYLELWNFEKTKIDKKRPGLAHFLRCFYQNLSRNGLTYSCSAVHKIYVEYNLAANCFESTWFVSSFSILMRWNVDPDWTNRRTPCLLPEWSAAEPKNISPSFEFRWLFYFLFSFLSLAFVVLPISTFLFSINKGIGFLLREIYRKAKIKVSDSSFSLKGATKVVKLKETFRQQIFLKSGFCNDSPQ